jgi:hypothetical protein
MRPSWLLPLALAACSGASAVDLDGGVSDGATGDGGSGGEGGTVPDGGGACSGQAASFQLTTKGPFCRGHAGDCSNTWLTILGPDGKALGFDNLCGTDCATCLTKPCPNLCAAPSPIPAAGVTEMWNGTYYTSETRVCNGVGTGCFQARCAVPGRYVARMCGYATVGGGGLPCTGAPTPTCTDVPFDWPTTGTVSGTIGP